VTTEYCDDMITDVVIVGAGLSGIGTAYYLQNSCSGKSYTILEGRDTMDGTCSATQVFDPTATAYSGLSLQTLYKQYTEVYEPGGVQFAGFNIDANFANCVDGLIIVDLNQLKQSKRERYINSPD